MWRKYLFSMANSATDWFPNKGGPLLDSIIPYLLSNRMLLRKNFRKYLSRLLKVEKFEKIVVISDLNIGDAVNLQATVYALRDFFPKAEIDYVVSKKAACLLRGVAEISTLYPVLSGNAVPHDSDFQTLLQVFNAKDYDVIFNFCPYVHDKHLAMHAEKVISFAYLASTIIRNESKPDEINHIIFQAHQFIYRLFSVFASPAAKRSFRGVDIALSDEAISKAKEFFLRHKLDESSPIVFLNPDASSQYTRIPLASQIELLKSLAGSPRVAFILLGAGHSEKYIEQKIWRAIPFELRKKVIIVPATMPLDAYAALIDLVDVFITGDTGPLHIAASRKLGASDQRLLRNKTAVYSIFGATPARIYGYDSLRSGFFPTNQAAPAHTFRSDSPCRNITCVNKSEKHCTTIRCFHGLDVQRVVTDIESYLANKNSDKLTKIVNMPKTETNNSVFLKAVSL